MGLTTIEENLHGSDIDPTHNATIISSGMAGEWRSWPPAPDILHELENFS
jgi:hypothetical protein